MFCRVVDREAQELLAPNKPYKPLVVKNRTQPPIRAKPAAQPKESIVKDVRGEPTLDLSSVALEE